jgi:hypothetical protein
MKHVLLLFFFCFISVSIAQGQSRLSPTEKKINDNLCACLDQVDMAKITDKASAEKSFMDCFGTQLNLMVQLAEEKKLEITDQAAMKRLGEEVGKNLFKENCKSFMNISMAMAKGNDNTTASAQTGTTEGRLKRIDTKDFNYFVVTDASNNEKSFLWFRQFAGSDKFTANASAMINSKLKIKWQEIEVYIPSAKNYYKIKEVVGIEVL